jgi:hypothetical protein
MTPHHAILLKTYDSEPDGRARFLGHSAFDDPSTPPDAPMRSRSGRSRFTDGVANPRLVHRTTSTRRTKGKALLEELA